MGVDRWIAQGRGHPLDHRFRHRMLQPLGLFVDCVPGVAEELDQVGLDQPVPPDHPERGTPALLGELHAAIGDVLQKPCSDNRLTMPVTEGAKAPGGWRSRWWTRDGPPARAGKWPSGSLRPIG